MNADINSEDHDAAAYGRVLQERMDVRGPLTGVDDNARPDAEEEDESDQLAEELQGLQVDASIISVISCKALTSDHPLHFVATELLTNILQLPRKHLPRAHEMMTKLWMLTIGQLHGESDRRSRKI